MEADGGEVRRHECEFDRFLMVDLDPDLRELNKIEWCQAADFIGPQSASDAVSPTDCEKRFLRAAAV